MNRTLGTMVTWVVLLQSMGARAAAPCATPGAFKVVPLRKSYTYLKNVAKPDPDQRKAAVNDMILRLSGQGLLLFDRPKDRPLGPETAMSGVDAILTDADGSSFVFISTGVRLRQKTLNGKIIQSDRTRFLFHDVTAGGIPYRIYWYHFDRQQVVQGLRAIKTPFQPTARTLIPLFERYWDAWIPSAYAGPECSPPQSNTPAGDDVQSIRKSLGEIMTQFERHPLEAVGACVGSAATSIILTHFGTKSPKTAGLVGGILSGGAALYGAVDSKMNQVAVADAVYNGLGNFLSFVTFNALDDARHVVQGFANWSVKAQYGFVCTVLGSLAAVAWDAFFTRGSVAGGLVGLAAATKNANQMSEQQARLAGESDGGNDLRLISPAEDEGEARAASAGGVSAASTGADKVFVNDLQLMKSVTEVAGPRAANVTNNLVVLAQGAKVSETARSKAIAWMVHDLATASSDEMDQITQAAVRVAGQNGENVGDAMTLVRSAVIDMNDPRLDQLQAVSMAIEKMDPQEKNVRATLAVAVAERRMSPEDADAALENAGYHCGLSPKKI